MIRELKSFFPWRSWHLGDSLKTSNVHNSDRIAIVLFYHSGQENILLEIESGYAVRLSSLIF